MVSAFPAPVRLRCEHSADPLGIDAVRPQFGWWLDPSSPGRLQSAYRIVAASSEAGLEDPDLWDTGRVESRLTHGIEWSGAPLRSRMRVWWRVRVWSPDSVEPSDWSAPAWFEMGLLRRADWKARWVVVPRPETAGPVPMLRTTFHVGEGEAERARLYVTARGLYEVFLNGTRVGEDRLAPGWTDYRKRLAYLTYDVTALLRPGENVLAALLADGWHNGRVGWAKRRNLYGPASGLLAQLEIAGTDGRVQRVVTGPGWKQAESAIRMADLLDGEEYDARLEQLGWDGPGFDDSDWAEAGVEPLDRAVLEAKPCDPIRATAELPALTMAEPEPGRYVFDLGQNIAGVARIRVRGGAGQTVTVRFAEMLEKDGRLYNANYRSARCVDRYTFGADGEATWEPRFTYHGFRYVELSGCEPPREDAVTGVVLHSALAESGTFRVGHAGLERLQSNIQWGLRGNFVDVPTDCPQRDERLGWTGDAQVFARTASFNRDTLRFYRKWMRDLQDGVREGGAIPHVAPDAWPFIAKPDEGAGAAAWADAAVIVPWTVYRMTGDRRMLQENFELMRGWVRWQAAHSENLVPTTFTFGDWLDPSAHPRTPDAAKTPAEVVATAYLAWSADLTARAAAVLGREPEAARLRRLAARVRRAFAREFLTRTGRIVGHAQTGYLLALGFDLLPAAERPRALAHLVALLARSGGRLQTGFVGTPLLAPVLSRFGRADLAAGAVLSTGFPGWLFSIAQGATTLWERWDSYTHERGFGEVSMNSFNHYAYGVVGEWLYHWLAGLDQDPGPAGAGWARLWLHPTPVEGIGFARAGYDTPSGHAACGWEFLAEGALEVSGVVPPNTHADFDLPVHAESRVEGVGPITDGRVLLAPGPFRCRIEQPKVVRPPGGPDVR